MYLKRGPSVMDTSYAAVNKPDEYLAFETQRRWSSRQLSMQTAAATTYSAPKVAPKEAYRQRASLRRPPLTRPRCVVCSTKR